MKKIIVKWKTLGFARKEKEVELPAHATHIHTEFGGWLNNNGIWLWWKEYGNDRCKKLVSTTNRYNLDKVKIQIITP